jgi:hypothetical protein
MFINHQNHELQLDATITVNTVTVASSWSSIFTLPTLMMHGQTQIKFTRITLPSLINGLLLTPKSYGH